MSLSDLSSLGSFVSGVAVLVSLIFLYFQVRQVNQQVRQAERNQRATIAQVRAGRTADAILTQTDPSVAMSFRRAFGGAGDLTATEVQQFISYVRAFLINSEDTFQQRHHGLMEDAAYRAYLRLMGAAMANPSFRVAWQMQRGVVGDEFAAFIDGLIAETPLSPTETPEALLDRWKSGWAGLTRADGGLGGAPTTSLTASRNEGT